jgi:GNAT superfamily N-acetyltransferase
MPRAIEARGMLSVSIAKSPDDFEVAAGLCRLLGEWDAATHEANGIAAEIVVGLFHSQTNASLADRFSGPRSMMLIARWEGAAAGCIAWEHFDETADEIHKFYVDPAFRRRGIGGALMRGALGAVDARGKGRTVLQTSLFMSDAIAVYRSFGFGSCAAFRPVPDILRDTEIFMSRPR